MNNRSLNTFRHNTASRNTVTRATGEEATSTIPASVQYYRADPNPTYGWLANDGYSTAGDRMSLRKEMRIATWKVRTLYQLSKLTNVLHKMNRCNIELLGPAEMRWAGQGAFKTITD